MNARIITALLALLGFGAACSGVKETAKSTDSRADSVRGMIFDKLYPNKLLRTWPK